MQAQRKSVKKNYISNSIVLEEQRQKKLKEQGPRFFQKASLTTYKEKYKNRKTLDHVNTGLLYIPRLAEKEYI